MLSNTGRTRRENEFSANAVGQIVAQSRARLVLSVGPGSGARPQDAPGSVNITNTARFDLVGDVARCPFNHQTYNNDWMPEPAPLAAARPWLISPPASFPSLKRLAEQVEDHGIDELMSECWLPTGHRPQIEVLDIATLTTNGFQVADDQGSHDHFACIEDNDAVVAMACAERGQAFGLVHAIADPVHNSNLPPLVQERWGCLLRCAYGPYAAFNSVMVAWTIASAA